MVKVQFIGHKLLTQTTVIIEIAHVFDKIQIVQAIDYCPTYITSQILLRNKTTYPRVFTLKAFVENSLQSACLKFKWVSIMNDKH